MRGQKFLAAGALMTAALLTAGPASAQQYSTYHDANLAQQQNCQLQRNNRTTGGAVIGAITGAVLGSQVAARGHRTDGSVLGGVVGAVAGAAIGRGGAQCGQVAQGAYDPYTGRANGPAYSGGRAYDPYANQQPANRGYDDGSGLYGGPYDAPRPQRSSYGGRRSGNGERRGDCRWGEMITRDPDGYEMRESVYMCRGRDGAWRPQG